ncbi:MAG TPA: hemolysin family protein [Candidatus Binataceae bacterium]|nr:hemolysin family protein [Candidatus Binataceae bacterium]
MLMLLLPVTVGVLVMMSATLAGSETAIFALVRMEHTREQLASSVRRSVEHLMQRPVESLLVIIGLNEACNIFAECLATSFLILWLGAALGPYIAAPVMLVIVLIFCDITPKTFALGIPGAFATLTAGSLVLIADLVHPVTRYLAQAEEAPTPEAVSEAEFKALLRLGEHSGEVEPAERAMIHRMFDLGARRAADVMTPRERMFVLDIATPANQLIADIVHEGYTRVPIYRGTPDNIAGILHTKDLVARRLDPTPPRIERLVRPAYFIPPGKSLGDLFDEMRRGRFQMALVVNEYGKLLGLVTLNDLLEELFGEIRDEFDIEVPEFAKVSDHEFVVSGAIDIKQLNQHLPVAIAPAGGRTLASIVLRKQGRVPRVGEHLQLGEYEATVESVRGATVELVRLRR